MNNSRTAGRERQTRRFRLSVLESFSSYFPKKNLTLFAFSVFPVKIHKHQQHTWPVKLTFLILFYRSRGARHKYSTKLKSCIQILTRSLIIRSEKWDFGLLECLRPCSSCPLILVKTTAPSAHAQENKSMVVICGAFSIRIIYPLVFNNPAVHNNQAPTQRHSLFLCRSNPNTQPITALNEDVLSLCWPKHPPGL